MDGSFGIKLPGLVPRWASTYREVADLVADFERMGFDDVVDGEHVLFTPVMEHPGGAGGMIHERSEPRSDRADTIVTFSTIAARTERIKLFSGILLPAAHSFAVLARQLSTLDLLSGGRFVCGVGMGWNSAEFLAQGIAPSERDARAEDVVRACLELWQPGLSTYHGRWITFTDVVSEPAPLTPGGPPIWWGGNALKGATARRVAEFCAGWISREAASYDEVARSIDAIRAECQRQGRDPGSVGFRCSLTPTAWQPGPSVEGLISGAVANATALAGLGVTHFTIPLNYYQLDLDDVSQLLKALRDSPPAVR
jgi:probable F420-dependent oxidoreductase